MFRKIIITCALLSVTYCCSYIKNVEVRTILRNGLPFVANVSGCIERKSFLDGNKTRNIIEADIYNQDLSRLEKDSIRHFLYLQKLTIRNTNLHQMDPNIFRNTPRLENVEITSNQLEVVADGVFNYQDFKIVSLRDNKIHSLDDLAFSYMNHLERLDMSSNKLKIFNGAWFYHLPNLTWINFRHNEIDAIPQSAFLNISNVTNIYLNRNNIANIEPNAFEGLLSLKHLDLKYNLLKAINLHSFPHSFKINILNINANRLNFLTKTLLLDISVDKIILDGNPWNCYCYRNMEKLLEHRSTKIMFSPECQDLTIPVCSAAFSTRCDEEYNEELTKYYYKQIVYQRNSSCVRHIQQEINFIHK